MKLLRYFLSIVLIFIGAGGIFVKNYMSSPEIQKIIKQELELALTEIGGADLQVNVTGAEWAGLSHPFSITIKQTQIKNIKHEATLKDLTLGIDVLRLLRGTPHLKRLAIPHFTISNKHKKFVSGELDAIIDLPKIALRVNRIDLDLSDLADIHPTLSPLSGIFCPASFTISADYDGHEIRRGVLRGTIGAGDIIFPPYYPKKTPLEEVKFEITLTPSKIKLVHLTLQTQDALAQLSGTIRSKSILTDFREGRDLKLSMKGNLDRLPVDLIDVYWPQGLASNARRWVTTNLSKGQAQSAIIRMKANLRGGASPDLTISELSGNIDAKGVDVAYLGDLPKVVNTSGHCRYTKANFIIDAQGTCDGMTVKDAHLDISRLDQTHGHMDIDLKVAGGLKPALNLISQKPLELTQKLGLDPKLFDGQAETHLKLSFPLDNSTLDDVIVNSTSSIKHASVTHPKIGRLMEGGLLDLVVTNQQLNLKGTALVAGHSSDIQASKSFTSNDRKLIINGKDTSHNPWFGAFEASLVNGKIYGTVDLSKSTFDIPVALFIKEPNTPGKLSLSGQYNDGNLALSEWKVEFNDAVAHGSGKLAAPTPSEIIIKSIIVGSLRGQGKVTINDHHLDISGKIKEIDLDHLYHHYNSEGEDLPFSINADLEIDRLSLGKKLNFGEARARITQSKSELTSLKLTSVKPDVLEVFVTPEKSGVKDIILSCQNAGDVLDYFMPNSDFEGGSLNLVGQFSGKPGARTLKAEIDLRDFVAVKAPVLAQILSISSLDGIIRTLSGQGVNFSNTVGHLEWGNDQVVLKDIHASGSSIALTLNGTINFVTDKIAIDGELYPINSLNVMLAHIPLVGHVLGGEKNRGVFATAFKLTGKRQDPSISANPLSTIAPQSIKELYKQQVNPQ